MRKHLLFMPWNDDTSGSNGSDNQPLTDEPQPELPPSTDLVFTDYPFADGTSTQFCLSEPEKNLCENIKHAGKAYEVRMRVVNVGSTPSTRFTVKIRLEVDEFLTDSDEFPPFEGEYEGESLLPGQDDAQVTVTLPPLVQGQHYKLQAQILVDGQPLPHDGAYTWTDIFDMREAETTDTSTDTTNEWTPTPEDTWEDDDTQEETTNDNWNNPEEDAWNDSAPEETTEENTSDFPGNR